MVRRTARAAEAADQRTRPALPVLLADRQGVAFVATACGVESLRIPRRYWGMQAGIVAIPVSDEEVHAAELLSSGDAGTWPSIMPRTDLLAPALSRLLAGDHLEMSLQPGRDGLRVAMITVHDGEQAFPVAPKDALGFLAAVFQHAPRGVVATGASRPPRVLLSVRPSVRRHEYRLRLSGVVAAAPPATLSEIGLSPAHLEMLLAALERPAGILLVSGGPASGRTTTLDLLASTLAARGHRGGRIGARERNVCTELVWLAESISDWPFPESLHHAAPDFVVIDGLHSQGDLVLAARLASSGRLVLVGAPSGEPEALAREAAHELERGAAPSVPITVLAQSLVRTICRGCVTWRTLAPEQARRLGFHRRDADEFERRGGLAVAAGRGCHDCSGTGYSGLTGVFESAGPQEGSGSLPRLREDGWRRAVQGIVCFEDVAALPGAHRPMRTLREIAVHAGLSPAPLGSLAPQPAAAPGSRVAGSGSPVDTTACDPGAAISESAVLAELMRAARDGGTIEPQALIPMVRDIVARASGDSALQAMLAPTEGFHLARHSVNTALIAVRIAAQMGSDISGAAAARLALLHDAGLLDGGLDPDDTRPAVPGEAALDPGEHRMSIEGLTRLFGAAPEAARLAQQIARLHAHLSQDAQVTSQRSLPEPLVQVVALASLVEIHHHGPGHETPADLHDVTSVVMERHGRRFSPMLFRALLKAIPIFPIGALVELSSGDLARVVSLNMDNHFRPRVEITTSNGGEGLMERRVVDLSRAPFLHIRHRVVAPPAAVKVA